MFKSVATIYLIMCKFEFVFMILVEGNILGWPDGFILYDTNSWNWKQ